uniref:Uncharacterized protein n=1 Tax=Lactuca sativa TaxID=4236 RepID=A0A9R1VLL4_LACSA|nr:hypothetical protein LSAT_V11C400212410 [Lactuca sativa]
METLEPFENTTVAEKLPATQPTSHLSSKTELTSFNKLLMQRFPIPKMISVSLFSIKTIKGSKASGEVSSNIHLDELHDSQKLKEGGFKIVSHQEYIKRMHGLKDEIIRSWHSDDHVTTLKLSVKMTLMQIVYDLKPKRHAIIGSEKLLPSMSFFHACESLIFIFCMSHSGDSRLSVVYISYLELAILPCWRFFQDNVMDDLMRLVTMIRGVADPLASAYCCFFLLHCAQKLPQLDTRHLIACISDTKIVLTWIISMKETKYGNFLGDRRLVTSLMESRIEYTMKCIIGNPNQVRDFDFLTTYSLLVYYRMELLTDVVCSNVVEFLHLVDCSSDYSFDQVTF